MQGQNGTNFNAGMNSVKEFMARNMTWLETYHFDFLCMCILISFSKRVNQIDFSHVS